MRKDIIGLFLFVIALLIAIWFILEIRDQKYACVENPIQYGVARFSERYESEASCILSVNKVGYGNLYFTKDGVREYGTGNKLNISNLT